MKIIENNDTCEVIIDDTRIDGFISKEKCKSCNNILIYYEKYDTFFCAYCNEWVEAKCDDFHCMYCKDRPNRPLYFDSSYLSLLDILQLPQEIRNNSKSTILKKLPLGHPNRNQRIELAQVIKNLFSDKICITIIICEYDGSFESSIIDLDEIEILWRLWDVWSGNYIIMLPGEVETEIFNGIESDEELIKSALIHEKNLLLKSCDGFEFLHLFINN